MTQRSLRLQDGKSDKFWTIVLSGTSHTVTYGRYGTGGQTQTKDFPTTAAAAKSYDKLVAEKIKKGYIDDGVVSGNPHAAPTDAGQQEPSTSLIGKSPKRKSSAAIELKIERSLNLEPLDWAQATWREHVALERPAPRKFDIKLIESKLDGTDDIYTWRWFEESIPVSLSQEEAHFWLLAMLQNRIGMRPKELFKIIPQEKITGDISTADFYAECLVSVADDYRHNHKYIIAERLPKEVCIPFFHLFSWEQFLDLLLLREKVVANFSEAQIKGFQSLQETLVKGLNQYILPFLTTPEIAAFKAEVSKSLKLEQWPLGTPVYPSPLFYLAAYLGVASLQELVESWPDKCYTDPNQPIYWHAPQSIVFGLADPESVRKQMQRLGLPLDTVDHVRKWLAHTEFSAIDYIGTFILSSSYKSKIEELTKELVKCVQAPELAPVLLNLMLNAKAPRIAQAWLQKNPGNAIAGLIPIVTNQGKLAQAAIDFLISMRRQGHGAFIESCLQQAAPEVIEVIRSMVLESAEDKYIPLDDQSTPDWLQAALNTVKPSKKLGWIVAPADLPTITFSAAPSEQLGLQRLNDAQALIFLDALSQSELDQPHQMLSVIKEHIDRVVLDKFIWKLFEIWLNGGAPPKGKWAMQSIGLLGSDSLVFKLAPLIRIWPGESQHGRAVLGLECLRAIGTDAALMQINGIAQKIKFQGLKSRAQSCIKAIAKERGMTTEQLADRIIPDCDLDERGSHVFDFGPRQFYFVLGANLKPAIKDAEGKIKPDLPKPNSKDDSEKAARAIADWKIIKKQISEVVKIQNHRLEAAMVSGRSWPTDEFETLLVKHPVMTHLVQRLIWGAYDPAGKLVKTFRVTEDHSYSNEQEESCDLASIHHVRVIHPLHISEQSLSLWGEILNDYEIMPPFPQLGRTIYALEASELTQKVIVRFKDAKVPAISLVGMLEKAEWERGTPQDGGAFAEHYKLFQPEDILAVVEYDGIPIGYMDDWDDQSIDRCFFVPNSSAYPDHRNALPLANINPLIISEVLKDLSAIAAKAQ